MKKITYLAAFILILGAGAAVNPYSVHAVDPNDPDAVAEVNASGAGESSRTTTGAAAKPESSRTTTTGIPESSRTTTKPTNIFYLQNPMKFNTVGEVIGGFVTIFSYLAVIAGVLALIWVGFQFVLAQGKPDRMNELKMWLMWIIVGLAIVIGARIIVKVVINTLSSTNAVDESVISNANNALQQTNR